MLFHSFIFLVFFFPVVASVYHFLLKKKNTKIWFLIISSLLFYGYWDYRLLPVLIASVVLNWLAAELFFSWKKSYLITLCIILNLCLIALFKYANFFAASLSLIFHYEHQKWNILLPLGISFFTFQQIAYLADIKRGNAQTYSFKDYVLHIVFFPHLIAGPIVRHSDIIAQFENIGRQQDLSKKFAQGVTLFILGMAKKVLLADNLAKLADPLFNTAPYHDPNLIDSWVSTFSYGFQVYFDFSGYSDMAIGLALMFGFVFPENFNSPYKAKSIQDFWRRWHITLSNLIRDYIYIPLGGSRNGFRRQIAAILISMSLCGLWHGAAFGYVIWGFLHGMALVINNVWRKSGLRLNIILSWFITFIFVMVSWIFFRAVDLTSALRIFQGLFTFTDIGNYNHEYINLSQLAFVLVSFSVCLIAPTSAEIMRKMKLNRITAFALALFLIILLLYSQDNEYKSFIYFVF